MIVVLTLLTLVELIDPTVLGDGAERYLSLIILELLVYALPAVFFCRLRGRDYGARLRVRFFSPSCIFLIVSALLAQLSGCALLNYGVERLFPGGESTAVYAGVAEAGLPAVLAMCILPAVAEEFLFRGILLAEYETVSVPFAVIVSALCFGMIHLNFRQLPAYVFSGVILAIVLYATRSLLAAMLLHMLHNIASLWTDIYVVRFSAAVGERSVLLVFLLMCVLFLSLIFLFLEAQQIYRDYGERAVASPYVRRRKRGEPSGALEAISTPPFVIFVIMYIIFTLVAQ